MKGAEATLLRMYWRKKYDYMMLWAPMIKSKRRWLPAIGEDKQEKRKKKGEGLRNRHSLNCLLGWMWKVEMDVEWKKSGGQMNLRALHNDVSIKVFSWVMPFCKIWKHNDKENWNALIFVGISSSPDENKPRNDWGLWPASRIAYYISCLADRSLHIMSSRITYFERNK